jgi:hypothetical protein
MAGNKGYTFSNDLLNLIFNAVSITGIAVNDTGTPLTNLYVALHTADPAGSGHDQTTSEVTVAAYNTYVRQAVARGAYAGWTQATTGTTDPVATISFPAMVSGTGCTATHFSVGVAISGASKILYSGPISPTINISAGVTPQLTTASAISEA